MTGIVLKGYILVPQAELPDIIAALPEHIALTRREPGCRVFEVQQDAAQPDKFNVYEEFASREAFEAHQLRLSGSAWGQITQNVERHYQLVES